MKFPVDITMLQKAYDLGLRVSGLCDTPVRLGAVEDAIRFVQNGEHFNEQSVGVKNYAGFGDQRSDHEYGYGPKHGHIVFCIGLRDSGFSDFSDYDKAVVTYALECIRDDPHGFRFDRNSIAFPILQTPNCGDLIIKNALEMARTVQTLSIASHQIKSLFAEKLVEPHVALTARRIDEESPPAKSSIPHNAVCVFPDGEQWCAVYGDFVNLQESPAGFGADFESAIASLREQKS